MAWNKTSSLRGLKGDAGDPGSKGDPGAAATVSVGTTNTGVAGTNAAVTNSGTAAAATFNFTIPRGADGAKGDPGAAATVSVGTTNTGAAGSNAAVTNSGSSSAAVFNFTVPRGADGAKGDPGAGIDAASAPAKAAPVDADDVILLDSQAGKAFRRLSWSAIKNAFASWYNSHVATLSNKTFDGKVPIFSATGLSIIEAQTGDEDTPGDLVLKPVGGGQVLAGEPEDPDKTYLALIGGLSAYEFVAIEARSAGAGLVDLLLRPQSGPDGGGRYTEGAVVVDLLRAGNLEVSAKTSLVGNIQINGLTPASTTGVEKLSNKTIDAPTLTGMPVVRSGGSNSQDGNVVNFVPKVPAGPTDDGQRGQIAADSQYLYVCLGPTNWRRLPLGTW